VVHVKVVERELSEECCCWGEKWSGIRTMQG